MKPGQPEHAKGSRESKALRPRLPFVLAVLLFDSLVLLLAAAVVWMEPRFEVTAGASVVTAFFVLGSLWFATQHVVLGACSLTRTTFTGTTSVEYRDIIRSSVQWRHGQRSLLHIQRDGGARLSIDLWTFSREDQEQLLNMPELRIDRS